MLANWTVFLDPNQNGILNSGETSVSTSATGQYTFTNLPAGTQQLAIQSNTGWTRTSPTSSVLSVTVVDNETTADVDWGYWYEHVIDNGDVGFSTVGSWTGGYDVHAHDADVHQKASGDGSAKATWRFDEPMTQDERVIRSGSMNRMSLALIAELYSNR